MLVTNKRSTVSMLSSGSSNPDRPPSWGLSKILGMRHRQTPAVGQMDLKRLERPRSVQSTDLFDGHNGILVERAFPSKPAVNKLQFFHSSMPAAFKNYHIAPELSGLALVAALRQISAGQAVVGRAAAGGESPRADQRQLVRRRRAKAIRRRRDQGLGRAARCPAERGRGQNPLPGRPPDRRRQAGRHHDRAPRRRAALARPPQAAAADDR